MKMLAQGAEAILTLKNNTVIKERVRKGYRIRKIDLVLRKQRTRREAKVLKNLPVPGPKLIDSDVKNTILTMEYLDGPKLADVLENEDYEKICLDIGKSVRKMHDKHIIHGDLTTSNMILLEKVYFIDFGLSFHSEQVEDKAVDIHLFRQALKARHHLIWQKCFKAFLKGYGDRNVIARLEKVESRGRNKAR